MRLFKILMAVLVPLLIVSGVALAQSGIGWFDFPGDVRVTGQVKIVSSNGVTTPLLTTTDLTVSGDVLNTRATTVTVTTDGTITPAGRYQPLSAAGNVQTSSIAGCDSSNEGRLVTFINGSNTTITITDTGTLKLSGNAALAQYDSLTVMCDTANWIEVGETNN